MSDNLPKWRRELEEILEKSEIVADSPLKPSETLYPDSKNRIKCSICGTLFQLPFGKFKVAKCPSCGQWYQRMD